MILRSSCGNGQGTFWKPFPDGIGKLPKIVAAVFCLRKMEGAGSKDICGQLGISESGLWIVLHRTRMALRRYLEYNWFEKL